MGELGLWLYLLTALGDDAAREAAAGWGGDRAMLLAPRAGVTDTGDGGVRVRREALADDPRAIQTTTPTTACAGWASTPSATPRC
jgi:hypothetical protein